MRSTIPYFWNMLFCTLLEYVEKMPSTAGILTEVVNVKVYQSILLEYAGKMPSTAGSLTEDVNVRYVNPHF